MIDRANPATLLFHSFCARYLNLQNRNRSWQVGEQRYDLGNDFYTRMLDSRMTYTCGYWKNSSTLEQAQFATLDLICKKLGLAPSMRVLDIASCLTL
ncbi:class I SAM-dependent methyltransferase [Pseudomonas sp. MDT1-85]